MSNEIENSQPTRYKYNVIVSDPQKSELRTLMILSLLIQYPLELTIQIII